jgi:predicted nucleotidyltransferase
MARLVLLALSWKFEQATSICYAVLTVQAGKPMPVKEIGPAAATRRTLVLRSTMVTSAVITDPVLVRFRKALDKTYGTRLERAVLYGSRARGDAHAESDYDVAVFLRDMNELGPELHRLAELGTVMIEETGEVVHAMPYRAGSYNERTPLMREIRRDGIEL